MMSQINNANNNQNVITNNNSTTIHGEQTTHPSDPLQVVICTLNQSNLYISFF